MHEKVKVKRFLLFEKQKFFCKVFIQNFTHSYQITFERRECWKWRLSVVLENLKLATRFSLKWNWYMELTKILKPDHRVLNNGQKYAGSQTNNPFDQSNLFVKASADSLWCKRCNSSKFTTLVSEDGEDGTVLFVNSRSLQNSTVKRMHAQ